MNKTNMTNNKVAQNNNQPVHKINVGGVQVSIWKNENFLNTSIQKSYLDETTNEWKTSDSFSAYDLLKLRVAIDNAIQYVLVDSKIKEE